MSECASLLSNASSQLVSSAQGKPLSLQQRPFLSTPRSPRPDGRQSACLATCFTSYNDPSTLISIPNSKEQDTALKRTINTVYPPKDSTFNFPIYILLADLLGVVELVMLDKDDWFIRDIEEIGF
ncbi:hypothetical protein CPB84DRAFT_1826881 [Gymnopilus junonius]|uniref:Uncharacterized protein n=1 Tax=Gymnopilus junonius TaxID=109634 RepID=A0A9P5TK70_GYMJU|nr:hypothetical protein CPB84DRAFT_1826881 [Gymnopilus junonius]